MSFTRGDKGTAPPGTTATGRPVALSTCVTAENLRNESTTLRDVRAVLLLRPSVFVLISAALENDDDMAEKKKN
ncbi:hypothetical protein HPB48_011245 [Haemaphysalis longicornis]|uniref:Uncharacterized protein n=1 Tax=Haemaphysalis longicornis TaxID=44386 RepID=A0A9J6GSV8_HAELO|nr:hypothetical protein HPB48_011245 [Haemaphysalis longicornis]